MAITSSAKKAIRSSAKKRIFNLRRKRALAHTVKEVRETKGAEKAVQYTSLATAYQAIDKAAKRGVINKKAAARKKSRLAKFLKP